MGIETSPLRDRAIFVVGVPRSGTTLLVSLLSMHPDVAGITGESHLFDKGVSRLFDNHEADEVPFLARFVDRRQLVDLVRDLCDGVLLAMRTRVKPEASHVVEKTPSPQDAGIEARKLEVYPDGYFVHIIREVDDVVSSLQRVDWFSGGKAEARARWQESVEGVRDALGRSERYIEIRYEELVRDPGATLERIFGHIGLNTDADVLARLAERAAYPVASGGVEPRHRGEHRQRGRRSRARARTRGLVRRGVAAAKAMQLQPSTDDPSPSVALAVSLLDAVRQQDWSDLDSILSEHFELDVRTGDGDAGASGVPAIALLKAVSQEVFHGDFIELGQYLVDGTSSVGALMSGTRGDGSRIDLSWSFLLDDGQIRRAALLSVGALRGRMPEELRLG